MHRGAFWYVKCIFSEILCNLLVTLKTMQNCNLLANLQKLVKSDL